MHADIKTKIAMHADEAVLPNVDATENEPPVLHAVTQQLRFNADAGAFPDRDQIEGGASLHLRLPPSR